MTFTKCIRRGLERGSIIDIDILSMLRLCVLPPQHDMCHEMCFMGLHNGTVYINSSTTISSPPQQCRLSVCGKNLGKAYLSDFGFISCFRVITCYVMSFIYGCEMIEFDEGKKRTDFPKLFAFRIERNNRAININICFGKLTIFRSSSLFELHPMLKKSKHIILLHQITGKCS